MTDNNESIEMETSQTSQTSMGSSDTSDNGGNMNYHGTNAKSTNDLYAELKLKKYNVKKYNKRFVLKMNNGFGLVMGVYNDKSPQILRGKIVLIDSSDNDNVFLPDSDNEKHVEIVKKFGLVSNLFEFYDCDFTRSLVWLNTKNNEIIMFINGMIEISNNIKNDESLFELSYVKRLEHENDILRRENIELVLKNKKLFDDFNSYPHQWVTNTLAFAYFLYICSCSNGH
jgi:hypothetical protein